MLTFVGLGLGGRGVSVEGINAIKESDIAYLEYYTSPHEPGLLSNLEALTGKQFVVVDRGFVEDGKRLIEESRTNRVVLAVQGDPMIATTHSELRTRLIRQGIETRIVHGATVASSAASESGLHFYKFGKTVTCTVNDAGFYRQVYQTVHRNMLNGLHTLLLLEFDVEKGAGVDPAAAMRGLLAAEANFKKEVIDKDTFMIVLSRIGTPSFEIAGESISQLSEKGFGQPPHCLIVPAGLHFTEREVVAAICGVSEDAVRDNGLKVRRTAQVLVPRYAEKTEKALRKAKESLDGTFESLFENVELYMKDAESFLTNDEDELAMLSIGYAEGLLDSLTFTDKFKVEW